jgi:hypothetical protein
MASVNMTTTNIAKCVCKRRAVAVVSRAAIGLVCCVAHFAIPASAFDFKPQLFGAPSRIDANVVTQDVNTGYVQFNGGALGLASAPVWKFGDGVCSTNWFPAEHTYPDRTSNYVVTVTGFFTDGATNSTELLVRFTAPSINYVSLPSNTIVRIPATNISLTSRMGGYGFSPTLTNFSDTFFSAMLTRTNVEYILSAAASVQMDYLSSNVYLISGAFQQYVLRDPAAGGMYSIWYSAPVAFGSADYAFQGAPQYSSFFHEMGHNLTLNFPANYFYGGKIDGNANAIYSETMAQILQHSTAYDLVNAAGTYGIPGDIAFEIAQSARGSMTVVRNAYEGYLADGTNFCSWNDPSTPALDEAFNTFMTIAYKFFEHAEDAGQGYHLPTKRLMFLLESLDENLRQRYDQHNDTPAADEFRATLMVTALSYAFQTNLTAEFRALNFPTSDSTYDELMGKVRADSDGDSLPDGWEYTHFGGATNATAGADPDGDGFNNLQEYLAGTDPRNSASVLAITGIQCDGQGVRVDWKGGVLATQYLERIATLMDTGLLWTAIVTNLPPTPLTTNVTAATTTNQMLFRIRAER